MTLRPVASRARARAATSKADSVPIVLILDASRTAFSSGRRHLAATRTLAYRGRKLHTTAKHSSSQQNQLRGMASTCDTIAGRCEEPSMRQIAIRLAASSVLPCLALAVAAAGALPVPPVKPGLWEVRMSVLDAEGHEVAAPEQAALSRMPPETRARMAEAMKARGLSMP